MAEIRVERLRKAWGPVVALDDVDFRFPESQVTCLLGPSGCGKTTLMRIVAGLERPTSGEVYFGDRRVTPLPPRKRDIGMVFQYPVVYRGISVYRNIELPLLELKLSKADRAARIAEVVEILGLGPSLDKDITRLDNGTRQKVAVARAVARQPRIILFDEPITNVDTAAKLQLKRAFKELTRRLSQTIVYVTHDQTEAMTLADQIALMRDGRIVQCDAPRALYNHPADRFGGWFLGNPGMNFFEATIDGDAERARLVSPLFAAPIATRGLPSGSGGGVTVGIRPEHVSVSPERRPGAVPATPLRTAITIGGQRLLTLRAGDQTCKAKISPDDHAAISGGGDVWVTLPLSRVVLFDASGQRLDATLDAGSDPLTAPGPR
jgi:ABC-type sugar transport system ATPase subunit